LLNRWLRPWPSSTSSPWSGCPLLPRHTTIALVVQPISEGTERSRRTLREDGRERARRSAGMVRGGQARRRQETGVAAGMTQILLGNNPCIILPESQSVITFISRGNYLPIYLGIAFLLGFFSWVKLGKLYYFPCNWSI
jgi:hypothetical protein